MNRTYRVVDGDRVEGTWRHVFIRNGDYHLTDLKIYADGMIDCSELVNLNEFAEKVRSGWVATTLPEGARASAFHMATWKFGDPRVWVNADELIGEVADEIDHLAGRPDSTDRCDIAINAYLADRTEENRALLRAAYFAIPAHLRCYALGDQDVQDRPLVALFDDDPDEREKAFDYFDRCEREQQEWKTRMPADGPDEPVAGAVTIRGIVYAKGWPEDAGVELLQNRAPVPIAVDGVTYPTLIHAYWALSTSDEATRRRIAEVERPHHAAELAREAPRRDGWADARVAVMAQLMRAKFRQHPDLAELLLSTKDAPIRSNEHYDSKFWGPGRQWAGRLLEVVRAELAAQRAGIIVP
ncbi:MULTISPECIES: NADAR family protein [Nocardia]|uniref:NADAR family protein n=1 Tax=Nocardia TaxID=1817 RepID=UPI000B294A9D|nr:MULTISPECIES: NADAR family protein [Nocardia]